MEQRVDRLGQPPPKADNFTRKRVSPARHELPVPAETVETNLDSRQCGSGAGAENVTGCARKTYRPQKDTKNTGSPYPW